MKLSYQWLKEYAKLPPSVTPEKVAEALKLATVEVEGVIRQGEGLAGVVVGRVMRAEKHPNADKLLVCSVDVGKEMLQIVCGGANVRVGMLVAVAKIGARVRWHGSGDPVEIQPTKLRGVESRGMICASSEIWLADLFPGAGEREILDLTGSGLRLGVSLSDGLELDDVIFEIDNKSLTNRPDLWGHYGMAREVAALLGRPFATYKTPAVKSGKTAKLAVRVENAADCPRYMAVTVTGVHTKLSPFWIQKRLLAAGVRPVNTIVDITNYVMLDIGEPMHAFDAASLADAKGNIHIAVRRARAGEKLRGLDGKDYTLAPEDILITDGEKPLVIAGVFGGAESGISEATQSIVFEAANFNAMSIRRTSTRLGLRTESSARFEKNPDPNLCETALRRAVELALELCPGARVASAVVDKKKFKLNQGPIRISQAEIENKMGVALSPKEITRILVSLGFAVQKKAGVFAVRVPSWRATKDISIAEDILEEIARVYGYHRIPSALPSFPIAPPEVNTVRRQTRRILDTLARVFGFSEVSTYSFASPAHVRLLGDRLEQYLELDNPLSRELPLLRRELIGNLLLTLAKNQEFVSYPRLVEAGKVFHREAEGESDGQKGTLPRQDTWLAAAAIVRENGFPLAHHALEVVGDASGKNFEVKKNTTIKPWHHSGRSADVWCEGRHVGFIYETHPRVSKGFGIHDRVGVMELNMSELGKLPHARRISYAPVPLFPSVMRDIAVVVEESATHADIFAAMARVDTLIHKVELFDVYRDDTMKGKKSMAYRLTLQAKDRTLTTEESDAVVKKALEILKKRFGAAPRSIQD